MKENVWVSLRAKKKTKKNVFVFSQGKKKSLYVALLSGNK